LLDGAATVLPVHPDDVGSVFHSYCFDFSVWEIWRILTTGGRCVFVPAEVTRDPAGFAQLLADSNISLLNIVPSVFANLVRAMGSNPVALPGLREIIFGGEAIDLSTVRAWRRLGLAPRAQLVNMYGITETTVHVTAKRLDSCMPAAGGSRGTPIGLPLPHLQVAVLGADGELAASGSAGEIYVSGAGVSAGYLWRPELTDQRFVHRNFGSGEMRWYRTGDLAVRDENGELSYIGRCDSQVQLRGYRIELGEVEAALRLEPGVFGAGAAVIPNRRGEPTLVGCYVPAGDTDVDTRQLRAAVRERLPGFMVPAVLVPVTELPVTPEGKLDRGVLARELQALTGNNGYPGYWLRPQERSLAGRTPELR
jgi:nonribosomal peptide synthetase DhbF